MMTREVLAVQLDGSGRRTVAVVPGRPSGIGFGSDGSALVVSMTDCRLLRLGPDGLEVLAELGHLMTGWLNDLVVTPYGYCYASNTGGIRHVDGRLEPGGPASICLVEPDGRARSVATDLEVSNGLAVSEDGTTLLVAETAGRRLSEFRIDDDGSLCHRKVFADLPETVPNGICMDAEGCVWVASHTGEYLRVERGSRIRQRLGVPAPVPGRRAVACMLGGEDRKTLLLCSVDDLRVEDLLRGGLTTGRLDAVRVAVAGAGWP
jgi:sugar lactone lactonase YvrE